MRARTAVITQIGNDKNKNFHQFFFAFFRRCEQARISRQNSKLKFCTISHMELKGVQNGV